MKLNNNKNKNLSEMPCGNEVSVKNQERKCKRSSSPSQGSRLRLRLGRHQGSSCISLIDDGAGAACVADQLDVLPCHSHSHNSNRNANKLKSRSYAGNRFSSNFHQSHALLLLLAMCLLMPLTCFGMPSNYNGTEILPVQSAATLNLVSNQEVSNEISTNIEETPAIEEDIAKFVPLNLGESLEDTIRNAVKNEIELDANGGSPALKKAIDVMPETENIKIVAYVPPVRSGSVENATTKIDTAKVVDEKLEIDAAAEATCDASSLVCKRVVKQDVTSTTITPAVVEQPVTAAEPVVSSEATPIETASTVETVSQQQESVKQLSFGEVKEEEFEQIEDNMREARNFESNQPEAEEIKPTIKTKIETVSIDHKISKDVLKSIIEIDDSEQHLNGDISKAGEPSILNYKAYEVLTTPKAASEEEKPLDNKTVEPEAVSESITVENDNDESPNLSNTQTSATAIEQSNRFKAESDAEKVIEVKSYEQAETIKDSNELLRRPLIEKQIDAKTVEEPNNESEENDSATTPNVLEGNEKVVPEPKPDEPDTEILSTETVNDSIASAATVEATNSDDITPVIADHSDFFSQETANGLKTEEKVDEVQPEINEAPNQNENETLSIVYKEYLTATEQPEDLSKLKELLENESIDLALSVELTTIQPEVPVHNVIKKQGVEPIVDEIVHDLETTPASDTAVYEDYNSMETTYSPNEVARNEVTGSENSQSSTMVNLSTTQQPKISSHLSVDTNHITEMSVVFAGKGDDDAVTTAKGSRSINSIHTASTTQHKASINFDVYPAGQTFNENLAEEMPNGIGKALPTHGLNDDSTTTSTVIITASSGVALLFIVISVGIFMASFQRQHGTLDIEMQEQRCGKERQDDEPETCIKLLDVELPPNTSLALQTDAEAEIECL